MQQLPSVSTALQVALDVPAVLYAPAVFKDTICLDLFAQPACRCAKHATPEILVPHVLKTSSSQELFVTAQLLNQF